MSHKIAAEAQKKPFFFRFYLIQPSAHTLHHLRSRKLERSNVWQHNFTKHSHAIISFSPSHSLEIIYFIIGFWETNRAITGFSQVIYPSRCALLLRSNPADYLLCRSGPPWPGGALVYRQLCFMTGIRIAGSWLDLSCSGDSWPRRREVHQLPFSHGSYTSAMSEADCCLSLWYRLEDCAGGGARALQPINGGISFSLNICFFDLLRRLVRVWFSFSESVKFGARRSDLHLICVQMDGEKTFVFCSTRNNQTCSWEACSTTC